MNAHKNTGHLIGYVGGLAVAAGVGTAVWLGTPTASADASSPSAHSAPSGTAKSARVAQRTTTVAAVKPGPARKAPPGAKRTTAQALRSATANYTPPSSVSADGTRQLSTTVFTDSQNQQNTTLTVTDTATGDPVGPSLTVLGDATSSPARFVTEDGSRVLLTSTAYVYDQIGGGYVQGGFKTWTRVVDTATGTVIGSPVVVRGLPSGSLITTGGSRAVITTYYDNPTSHKTSTRVAVIDTVTGKQVGSTVPISGQPSGTTPLIPGSSIVVSRTHLGLGAVIDTNSGAALVIPVAFPWGMDLSPLAPAVFIGGLFLGVFGVAPVLAVVRIVEEALHSIGVNVPPAPTP
ncbi:hypothetical protein [Mycolicibacterium sphagni]|uniref:Uncharacterized protein n=1 Tax=Mycolicibacterium sphagni TaxID=1786 RepID=A0ABX2JNH1_9MYCO|nr:hypothetical protein [Mycolicibacterium sphagni]NTY59020.1 hypothetical protein [Mycolicibacterium sphagni]